MAFWRSNLAKYSLCDLPDIIARSLLAILRQSIAKQAMTFGDHLSLKKRK
jgi:hypothetical protein